MRPNFALIFRPEGLELLHRGGDGAPQDWTPVGEVSFDHPHVSDEVAALKARAADLYPAPYFCTLVLPRDQLRFLETERDTSMDIAAQVRDVLDGATPYSLDQLAYCWTRKGDMLRIAAVALETSDEAEKFALTHGFAPVSVMAPSDPEDPVFPAAPYFGATQCAARLLGDEEPEPELNQPAFARGAPPDRHPQLGELSAPPALDKQQEALAQSAARALKAGGAGDNARSATPAGQTPAFGADTPAHGRSWRRLGIAGAIVVVLGLGAYAGLRGPVAALLAPPQTTAQILSLDATSPDTARPAPADAQPVAPQATAATGAAAPAGASAVEQPVKTATVAGDAPRDTAGPDNTTSDKSDPNSPDQSSFDPLPKVAEPLTPDQAEARYRATGIWLRAPTQPPSPPAKAPPQPVALPEEGAEPSRVAQPQGPDARDFSGTLPIGSGFRTPVNPPAPDQTFDLNAQGVVRATPDGARTPQGITVYAGQPPVLPPDSIQQDIDEAADAEPDLPQDGSATQAQTTETDAGNEAASDETAGDEADQADQDQTDQAADSGPVLISGPAIETAQPRLRPDDLVPPEPKAPPIPDGAYAAEDGLRPRARPSNFASVVATARPVSVPTASSEVTKLSHPSPKSVAKAATDKNELKLNRVALLGIFGKPSDRSALVRLPDGNVIKVGVGDTLDGGRVAAIGADELRYVRGGRNISLEMP